MSGRSVRSHPASVLAALFWALANSAAAEWIAVQEADEFTAYAERSTLLVLGTTVTMWDLIDLKQAQSSPLGNRYASSLAKSEFDCANDRFRTLYLSLHAEQMAEGAVVEAVWDPARWLPVAPGTLLKVLQQVACGELVPAVSDSASTREPK
jgi:hypothetical protein